MKAKERKNNNEIQKTEPKRNIIQKITKTRKEMERYILAEECYYTWIAQKSKNNPWFIHCPHFLEKVLIQV